MGNTAQISTETAGAKKRIYICGKVTGEERYRTVKKFQIAENYLQIQDWETINPVRHIPENTEWKDAMRTCVALLMECDAIYMLPCWTQSRGATLERFIAGSVGIKIIEAEKI